MKKVFTFLLSAAALLLHPALQAQKAPLGLDNPVFKAALERVQKRASSENARSAAAQTIRVPQTETYATWGENNQWEDQGRASFTYNNRGQLETVTEVELPSNTNSAQYTYVYNSQGINTELIVKEWENNAWVNSSRMTIELEGELLKNYGLYSWSGTAWNLMLGIRNTNNVTNGRVTETITESFSAIPGSQTNGWELSERTTYGYTGTDNRPTSLTTYDREGAEWVEVERETEIAYVGNSGNRSSYFLEVFDAMNNVWNKYKYEFQYSQNTANQTQTMVETAYDVEGTTTTPTLRTTSTILTSAEPYISDPTVGLLEEVYDEGTNTWVRSTEERSTLTRDNNGAITQIIVQDYNAGTNAFVNAERYTYTDFTTITITSAADDVLAKATEVYPNPVQNSLRVTVDATKVRNGTLNIYSITGQKVHEQHKLNPITTVDVSTLPAGIYMVRITDDNNANVTRRIIKQ
ncbi:T9SS type A sorting domain-containing protein [uncultured Pontibacter sp.]|uniref:T9SS type A sorting domain-containing protein n=1 Tax=uncultured Pontibacter sp. TaxID=453356 RepID=UPI00261679C7|nr:T9SS type A sorting domain-containing protein [uncultured Pontibacter sp.]